MISWSVGLRNGVTAWFYKVLFKPLVFKVDPEKVHDRMTVFGRALGSNFLTRWATWIDFGFHDRRLEVEVAGIKFRNPIGLSAGFDKNADLTGILPWVGFGFEEVGSVTGEPCEGNAKPRLWRLPKSESLVVYYGLKNDGAEVIAEKLARLKEEGKIRFPIGVSIAKTNCAETAEMKAGIADYVKAYREFVVSGVGDYFTINISCPNAFGGQPFADRESLQALLVELDKLYKEGVPVLVKLSPDLEQRQVEEIVEVCGEHRVDGFVCSNLTKSEESKGKVKSGDVLPEVGGLSGRMVSELADEQIEQVYKLTKGKKVIIGVGGIFTAEDVYRKLRKGANLVQLITGMIYEGPQLIGELNRRLVILMKKDGFEKVEDVVGVDVKQ